MLVTINHFDTCLSDYLQDHCNGDNEILLGVALSSTDTYGGILNSLEDEFDANTDERIPDNGYDAVRAEIAAMRAKVDTSKLTGWVDEDADEEDAETCYAWFQVSWTDDAATADNATQKHPTP